MQGWPKVAVLRHPIVALDSLLQLRAVWGVISQFLFQVIGIYIVPHPDELLHSEFFTTLSIKTTPHAPLAENKLQLCYCDLLLQEEHKLAIKYSINTWFL